MRKRNVEDFNTPAGSALRFGRCRAARRILLAVVAGVAILESAAAVRTFPLALDPDLPAEQREARRALVEELSLWAEEGGTAFHPSLHFPESVPTLKLVTKLGEEEAYQIARRRAILAACELAFATGDFALFRVTLVVRNAEVKGSRPEVRNVLFERAEFFDQVRRLSGVSGISEAVRHLQQNSAALAEFFRSIPL